MTNLLANRPFQGKIPLYVWLTLAVLLAVGLFQFVQHMCYQSLDAEAYVIFSKKNIIVEIETEWGDDGWYLTWMNVGYACEEKEG